MTVEEFLRLPTRGPHAELIFGFLRSAVAPLPAQAALIERLRAPLAEHLASAEHGSPGGVDRGTRGGRGARGERNARVSDGNAGGAGDAGVARLFVAPIDVVLDEQAAIVLRPPLVAVLAGAAGTATLRGRTSGGPTLWGAPDLVVEVLTPATARRIRCSKLRWYRQAGVRECWLLDTRHHKLEVLNLEAGQKVPHVFSGRHTLRSPLLPSFALEVGRLFRGVHGPRQFSRGGPL